MSQLILKVRWNHTQSYRRMSYPANKTVRAVIEDIKQKTNIETNKTLILHSPPTENGRAPIWLDNYAQTLDDYGIKDGDTIEVKLKPQTLNICMNDGNFNWLEEFNFSTTNKYVLGSIFVDFLDDISEYISTLSQLIPRGKLEEFCLQYITEVGGIISLKWLNLTRSFAEQDVKPNGFICLYPLSAIIQKKQGSDISDKVVKEGFLTKVSIKPHKKTQPKKRWIVVRGNFLIYYSSQSQSSPSGVVPLDYYDIVQEAKEKYQIILKPLLSFTKSLSTYIFECEENEFKEWSDCLMSRSAVSAGSTVFGVSLAKVMQRKSQNGKIPDIIVKSVNYLENNGLSVEGIFRLSGGASSVAKYKSEFDRGMEVELKKCQDPNVVAGLLKLYFRELPEPLIPFDLYDDFLRIDVLSIEVSESIPKIKSLVEKLPAENLRVLVLLLIFLKKVADNAEVNLMTPQNVSLVFGPNILRPKEGSPQSASLVQSTPVICKIIEIMIVHHDDILPKQKQTPQRVNRPVPPQRKSLGNPNTLTQPRRPVSFDNLKGEVQNNNKANSESSIQINWSSSDSSNQHRNNEGRERKQMCMGQRRNDFNQTQSSSDHHNNNNNANNNNSANNKNSNNSFNLNPNTKLTLEELQDMLFQEISLRKGLEEKISILEKEIQDEREERLKLFDLVQQYFN